MAEREWVRADRQKEAIRATHDILKWLGRYCAGVDGEADMHMPSGRMELPVGEAREVAEALQKEFSIEFAGRILHDDSTTVERSRRRFQSLFVDLQTRRSPYVEFIKRDDASGELLYEAVWGWTAPYAGEIVQVLHYYATQ